MDAILAVLVLVQDKPEELFAAVERKIVDAKTLRCKAKVEGTAKGTKSEFTGEAKFKSGNRMWFDLPGADGGKGRTCRIVCDGKERSLDGGRGEPSRDAAPEGFAAAVRLIVVRAGWVFVPVMAEGEGKPEDILKVSDFKLAADERIGERRVRVVEYTLKADVGRELKLGVRLFIDAERLVPLKRETEDAGLGMKMSEAWSDVVLDGEIADADFALPAKK